jgi:hypothetical protein
VINEASHHARTIVGWGIGKLPNQSTAWLSSHAAECEQSFISDRQIYESQAG